MGEPAKYMIAALEPDENPENEGKALAIRFTNSLAYEDLERLVSSMCRRIRTRPEWAGARPREIEQSMFWHVYSTDPGQHGWPYFVDFWQRKP